MRACNLMVVTLCAAATGQSTTVSPAVAATNEGNTGNPIPFVQSALPRRYMQIHGDLVGTPKVITKLSFRMTAGLANYTGRRTHDVEVWMGHAPPYPAWSFRLDQNYTAPRTQVLPRQSVVWGPQGQAVSPGPNPFTSNMDFLLATPFAYDGVQACVWEATIHSSTVTGTFSTVLDADVSTITQGSSAATGAGCTATGGATPMTHSVGVADVAGTLLLAASVQGGPVNAITLWALGLNDPDLPVPGLCSNLRTDLFQVLLAGSTDNNGNSNPADAALVFGNTIGGATLFSQMHCVDFGRPDPIPVSNSDGRSFTVPLPNTTREDRVIRLYNFLNAGGAAQSLFFPNSTLGFGLVVQFTW